MLYIDLHRGVFEGGSPKPAAPKGINNVPFVKGLINLQREIERELRETSRESIDRKITPIILMYSLTHNHTDREIHIYARESIPDNREMHLPDL